MFSSPLDVGTLLLLEGALVGALVIARTLALRMVHQDTLPKVIQPRISLGNRLAPAFALFAVAMFVGGALMHIVGG